ncbi:MAG: sulfotransferase family 2 domain-containing protein [Pseudomonadota bacterium]
MTGKFDYFVVFAEMRTGSNFLEANLNAFDGITCFGEAFNPHFIGYPNKTEILGIDQARRDASPAGLIWAIREETQDLGGFRFFHDHDPRVIDLCLDDPRCAKIILTRNPVESYVSWKIAQATGQWKLTNVKRRKDGKASFDAGEFETHVSALQAFQIFLLNKLQISGQTAFYLAYEDLQDVAVMNGLARFLGVESQLDALDASLKKQNPSPLSDKVENFEDMERALSGMDRFNLTRTPNFEPRRGAGVPAFVTGAKAPLLFMPVRSGPEAIVLNWLAALDGVEAETLPTQMNQKGLRQWKRRNKGHRSFTVLRHPLARAHHVFCTRILPRGEGTFSDIRKTLRNFYKLPIPGEWPSEDYTKDAHREAFTAFLQFLGANLTGQTNIRVDAHWATQAEVLQGFAGFSLPDQVIREDELSHALPALAKSLGYASPPEVETLADEAPYALADIYDEELEALAAQIYQRDYMLFGFESWSKD